MTLTQKTAEEDLNDAALLARLKAGDGQAFAVLVRGATGRLLAVARRFLPCEQDARDALQEAFLMAYKALPKFEERCALTTWLHSITVRACLMRLRQVKAKREESIESLLPRFKADGHQKDGGPAWRGGDAAAMEAEEKELVRGCIEKLPEDYRNVILMRDIEEMDTGAVAELLGVSEGVVKTRLHRARQALRTLLEPHFRRARS